MALSPLKKRRIDTTASGKTEVVERYVEQIASL
jgi:hypothetical protein